MIPKINLYVKEGIINAFKTSYGENLRPFDLIFAKCGNTDISNHYSNVFDIDHNICGIIINKYIISPHVLNDMIYDNDDYVLYYTNELTIDKFDNFVEKYGIDNIIHKKMKNNILDKYYIKHIRGKFKKICIEHPNDIINQAFIKFNIIIDHPDILKKKCINFDRKSFKRLFL